MILEVEGLRAGYGPVEVLRGISLQIPAGSAVAVFGRNGAGKTTLVRSIMGWTPPTAGRVVFRGVDITRRPPQRIARMGVAVVPQGRRVFPNLTVLENLTIVPQGQASSAWNLDVIYELFPVLRQRARVRAMYLSGGEQSMLALARALLANPTLLVMDEPSEGLAPTVVKQLAQIFRVLKQRGLTILLVEQNLSLGLSVADQVHVMSKGELVYAGAAGEFRTATDVHRRYLSA